MMLDWISFLLCSTGSTSTGQYSVPLSGSAETTVQQPFQSASMFINSHQMMYSEISFGSLMVNLQYLRCLTDTEAGKAHALVALDNLETALVHHQMQIQTRLWLTVSS